MSATDEDDIIRRAIKESPSINPATPLQSFERERSKKGRKR
jgi:hypothetical protein